MTDHTEKLVFIDVETTGLIPGVHDVWEIGYAVEDGKIEAEIVPHNIATADPEALAMNGYLRRGATRRPSIYDRLWFELDLREHLNGATVVGANPDFDLQMLAARWQSRPWHYRTLNIENYAMPAMGLDRRPPGLLNVCEHLGVEPGGHTAAGDVRAVRACYNRLRTIYALSNLTDVQQAADGQP